MKTRVDCILRLGKDLIGLEDCLWRRRCQSDIVKADGLVGDAEKLLSREGYKAPIMRRNAAKISPVLDRTLGSSKAVRAGACNYPNCRGYCSGASLCAFLATDRALTSLHNRVTSIAMRLDEVGEGIDEW